MDLFLAPGVHATQVRDDIVFLDAGTGVYFCLGGASDLIALGDKAAVEVSHEAPAEQMIEAGLLARTDPMRRDKIPTGPTASSRSPPTGRAPGSIAATIAALGATWKVSRTFSRASFASLLAGPPAAPSAHGAPTPALLEAVAQFERLRPWLPVQGECLLRSYHLRTFLRARGLDAVWVFGVRTWPFDAHCWLQAGNTALDDDLERLTAYQPILAV